MINDFSLINGFSKPCFEQLFDNCLAYSTNDVVTLSFYCYHLKPKTIADENAIIVILFSWYDAHESSIYVFDWRISLIIHFLFK